MKRTILWLGIVLILAEAIDAFLTLWAVNNGFQEVNPLMVSLAHTWIFPLLKIIPAAIVVGGLIQIGKKYTRTLPISITGLAISIMFMGIVLVANVGEIIRWG